MTAPTKTAAPTDSAPNAALAKAWKAEIHTPAATYNANVPLDAIEPDPKNRDKIQKEAIAKMAASIQAVGLLQPIVLRELGGGRYRIIAGEHRWRAHQALKLLTIRAMIYRDQSDLDAAKKKAVENAQRVDLTPIERAKRFRELGELGAKQAEIGELFGGLSQPVVANALRLLELPADVQAMLSDGRLSEAAGVSLARFNAWPKACSLIAALALRRGDTSKDLNEDPLPYSYELVRQGLAYEIETASWNSKRYELPSDFRKEPGVIDDDRGTVYYLKPADPKADKWLALKPKLDAERDAKAKAAEKKEGATQGRMTPADAAARRRKIAENKQYRAESARGRTAVFKLLQDQKDVDPAGLVIVCSYALRTHWKVKAKLAPIAKELGLKLGGGFNSENYRTMAKMKPADVLRLTVGCICASQSENGCEVPWPLSDEVEHVLGAKKSAAVKQAAAAQLAAEAKAKAAKKKGGAK